MAEVCQVCRSPHLKAVNGLLLGGEKDSVVSRRFSLSPDAVRRHRILKHFPASQIQAAAVAKEAETAAGTDNMSLLRTTRNRLLMIGQRAEHRGDERLAVTAYAEANAVMLKLVGIESGLPGEISIGTMNVVAVQQNFVVVQTAILAALADEPSARAKVLLALEAVEHEAEP